MEITIAIDRLSALAQPGRLAVFRLLVRHGPQGLPAGDISTQLGLAANTLSSQLSILSQAGLICGERQGRSIRYRACIEAVGELIICLMEDCCDGRPEICQPVQAAADRAVCGPASGGDPRGADRQ